MKQLRSILFIFLSTVFIISCSKDNPQDLGYVKDVEEVMIHSRSSKSSNFYDLQFTFDSLNLYSNYDGYVSNVDDLITFYKNDKKVKPTLQDLEDNNVYPCWYCTEGDHYDALYFHTPLYNLATGDFEGILITKKENEIINSEVLIDELAHVMATSTNERLPIYLNKVFDYFRGGVKGKKIEDYSGSRRTPCKRTKSGSAWCVCSGPSPDCTDQWSNGENGLKCFDFCGQDDGSGTNNNPGSNLDPYAEDPSNGSSFVGTCWLCGGIGNIDGPGGGGGNPNSTESEFDIEERQEIIAQILQHIESNTNIHTNLGTILALLNSTQFDFTTYILYQNLETLSEDEIEAFLNFITNHPQFINTEEETLALLNDAELTNRLNDFLSSFTVGQFPDPNGFAYNVGHIIAELSATIETDALMDRAEYVKHLIQDVYNDPNLFSSYDAEFILSEGISISDMEQIFNENQSDDYSKASLRAYVKLASNGLLDLTYTDLENLESTLSYIIDNSLLAHGLGDRLAISAPTWYMMFQTEANSNNGSPIEWLRAEVRAIKEGFLTVFQPIVDAHVATLQNAAGQLGIPNTTQEWRALMAVFGPMLIELGVDIGTDFIPGVGEIKSFTKSAIALSNGNYGEALFEFIGGVVGIVPIGDIITGSGKVIIAAGKIFVAFKVIKALARVSGSIYNKLIELAQLGWKIVWDGVSKRLKFKSGGEVVGEIVDDVEDLSPNIIIQKPAGKTLLLTNSIKNLNPIDISSPNTQSLASLVRKDPANHMRFTPNNSSQQSQINNIINNGDETGELTELLMKDHLAQDGWVHKTGGKYGSNNGYDNVFYNESTGEILIDESKQWGPKLTGATTTNPKQMSDAWIDKVSNIISESDPDLFNKIVTAKEAGLLRKTVSAVKKTNPGKGSIITIRVD